MGAIDKINGFFRHTPKYTPIERVDGGKNPFAAKGTGGVNGTGATGVANYAQYAQPLEHGYSGVQYGKNGAVLGKLFCMEM